MELFHKDPTVQIVSVVDKNERAPGLALARQLGLRVSSNYRKLLAAQEADLIIDVTGDPNVARDVYERKSSATEASSVATPLDSSGTWSKPVRKPKPSKIASARH